MPDSKDDETMSADVGKRGDEILRRMLKTTPQPHKDNPRVRGSRKKAASAKGEASPQRQPAMRSAKPTRAKKSPS